MNSRTPSLDCFQELVESELVKLQRDIDSSKRHNLTRAECVALLDLQKKNRDIIVCQEDKGGNIVILDAGLYKELNTIMLSDNNTYIVLNRDPTEMFSKKLK